MAWLSAVPEDASVPRALRQSRAKAMLENGAKALPLPPIHAATHLIDLLFDIGPGVPAMAGLSPIGYADIQAWVAVAGWPLQPWEAQALRKLSVAYCTEVTAAKAADSPPPMLVVPEDRASLSRRLGAALKAMAHTGKSR